MAMTRKRPWNRIDVPVYSLATVDPDGVGNMNICTYISAVSMKPKLYAVAVYRGTKTLANIESSSSVVLQLLGQDQLKLVRRLGFTTGMAGPKLGRIKTEAWSDVPCLVDALARLELRELSRQDAGDHILMLMRVTSWCNLRDGEALTLDDLRRTGMIRS